MNSYKLNVMLGNVARLSIINGLCIKPSEIYVTVKSINITDKGCVITTKDNKKYRLILEDISNEID